MPVPLLVLCALMISTTMTDCVQGVEPAGMAGAEFKRVLATILAVTNRCSKCPWCGSS